MSNKNSLPIGLAIGILFPVFGFSAVYGIFDILVSSGLMDQAASGIKSKRMRTIILIGICTNVFWLRKYNQRLTDQTLRGVVIGTMLWAVGWFIMYYSDLYVTEL